MKLSKPRKLSGPHNANILDAVAILSWTDIRVDEECFAIYSALPFKAVDFLTDVHEWHPKARYWVSFVDPVSDWYSTSIPAFIYVISYDIGQRYNDTRLYYHNK